jgi:hypothetical protein
MDIKPEDFNLEKELAQSKININLNDLNDSNKFLITREWDCFNDNNLNVLEAKVEAIYEKLDKKKLQKIIDEINKYSFEKYYSEYKITENKFKISCLCSLNFLVESTYYFRENYDELKKYDSIELEPYVYKYRNVNGDGDCFYRGLIFSLLENIILTNYIMQMKELLILYYEKINKNNKLIKEKEYLKTINELDIDIVSIIFYIIINQMENDVSKAYKVLLKAFINFKEFDFSLIFFTRYLIYEYISANEDKIFSKEFALEVGCLLPDGYVVDKGSKNEYLFENFYNLQLMKPKTFAEKIVLYVVPFVFNIDMKILLYDFGNQDKISRIEEKKFFNENKSKLKIEIDLLYRKSHYDIYYTKKSYEDNKKILNVFLNIKENEIEKMPEKQNKKKKEKTNDKLVIKQNNKKENGKNTILKLKQNEKPNEKQNISSIPEKKFKENILDEDEEEINQEFKQDLNKFIKKDDKNNNSQLCLECRITKPDKDNIYGLCDDCLSDNLKNLLYSAFYDFLKKRDNLINSKKKFQEFLMKKKCKIAFEENISLLEAINNSKFKFEELFASARSLLCLFCGKTFNFEDEFFIELPCKCRLCSKKCFIQYFNVIKNHIKLETECNLSYYRYLNVLNCYCGFQYNTKNVIFMINEMEKKDMKEQKKIYQEYILNIWNWRCCLCYNAFKITGGFGKIFFKSIDEFKEILNSEKDFKHLLCDECYQKNDIKNQKIFACNICELKHEIIDYKKVNEKNEEESCIIF